MKKRIMFVCAGKYQVAGIQKAKDMGLQVIAIDGNHEAEGFKIADTYYALDIKDLELTIKIAKENKIDGVLTVASDVGLKTAVAISESLGLPGIGVDVAERCTDKELMRKTFFENGVPSPKSYAVYCYKELLEKTNEIGWPAVVKPADNAGSRGVKMVRDKKELREAYKQALENSRKKKVLIEEFMEGVEVSVEVFVNKGKVNIVALSDKVRTPPPFLLDTEVIFPSAYSNGVKRQIISIAEKAIRAVGIKMGPVHMELMMTENGPVPVELAARGPGFKVFTDIIPMVTGIDILKALIDVSLGDEPNLMSTRSLASAIKFFDTNNGIVKEICGVEEIRKIDGIYEIEIYVKPGDSVRTLTCGSDRIGHVISLAETREKAVEIIKNAKEKLQIKLS